MGEFRISYVRITFWSARWRDEKGGHRGGWMEPPRRCREMGWGVSPHPNSPTPTRWQVQHHPPLPTPRHPPISPTPREDALEGLYFVDRRILRCLPYFFRKTRPRASYELLEAFLPSCGECGVTSGVWRAPSPISHSPHPDIPISPTSTRMP